MAAKMPALFMAFTVLSALCTVVQGGSGLFGKEFEKEFEELERDFGEALDTYSSSLHFQNVALEDDAALDMMV